MQKQHMLQFITVLEENTSMFCSKFNTQFKRLDLGKTNRKLPTLVNVLILFRGAGGQEVLFKNPPSFIAESIELNAISDAPNDCETMDDDISC